MNKLVITKDKSPTLFSEQFQQTYHSIHGALAESQHVFIQNGLDRLKVLLESISIFEMGFGTGLNAALAWQYSEDQNLAINYYGIEKFPISEEIIRDIKLESTNTNSKLEKLHSLDWNQVHSLDKFVFKKEQSDLKDFQEENKFDIIFYDAFAPNAQPELWTDEIFQKMYKSLKAGGLLTTYCAKGEVKRSLKRSGFTIESPPGPVGKREMTLAFKAMNN